MSCSIYTYLVVGIRLSDVFHRELINVEVTKYNEDTGQPYTKTIAQYKNYLFGKEVEIKEPSPNEWGNILKDFDVFDAGCESRINLKQYDYRGHVIGKPLIKMDGNYGRVEIIDQTRAEVTFNLVSELLKNRGYDKEPELFMICNSG